MKTKPFDFTKRNREYLKRLTSPSFQRKMQDETARERERLAKRYAESVTI